MWLICSITKETVITKEISQSSDTHHHRSQSSIPTEPIHITQNSHSSLTTNNPPLITRPGTFLSNQMDLAIVIRPGSSPFNKNDPATVTSQKHYPHDRNDSTTVTSECSLTNTNVFPSPLSNLLHSQREKHIPSCYSDFIPSNSIVAQLFHIKDTEINLSLSHGPSSITDLIPKLLDADDFLDSINNIAMDDKPDPPSIHHAQCSKYYNKWLTAMHKELEALNAKEVYEPISELSLGQKAIQCKWALHIKHDQSGQISCFKE